MTDPIRNALATDDDAELGRLMRTQHAALLASIAGPESPYGGASGGAGDGRASGSTPREQGMQRGSTPPASTLSSEETK